MREYIGRPVKVAVLDLGVQPERSSSSAARALRVDCTGRSARLGPAGGGELDESP